MPVLASPQGLVIDGRPGDPMQSALRTGVPAVVVGRGPTALGILRCLRMAGIDSYVACPRGDHVTASRWYRPTPGAYWDGALGAAGHEALERMPLEKAVLIAGADDAAQWVSGLPGALLGSKFVASTASWATQALLQDKSKFAQFLSGTDMPHPRTFYLESADDVAAVPFDELDRVFLKPINSQQFSDVVGVKGVWVGSRAELLASWQSLHAKGFKLMAQEYVPGTAADHYFIDGFRDRHGVLTGLFARRRYRISPPDFGNSSYCESIALADLAVPLRHLETLLAALAYRGIFSAEFKRDARDGAFRILEINSRAWTYVEFAARCGVNVCQMAWRDALELEVSPAPALYDVGAGCVDFYRDFGTLWAQRHKMPLGWWAVIRQWTHAHYHSFRLDDPRPALGFAAGVIGRHARDVLRPQRDASRSVVT
jgi:predicted ATP-grasp superfamily ATP-dependent carboligase